jgi:hypothetical protein
MDNSNALKEYVAFYGSYIDILESPTGKCDRCREVPFPPAKLTLWMSSKHFRPANGPYLCMDCARHFGLVW